MKVILSAIAFLLLLGSCDDKGSTNNSSSPAVKMVKPVADNNPYTVLDVSPMDMTYFPVDYTKLKMANLQEGPPLARVIYSRPHLQGRHLFHEVQKYGEPWRLGANESTELQLFSDAYIQNKKIKAGRYILYCIPQPDQWTIILNKNIDTWGLKQDSTQDFEKFVIPVKTVPASLEYYTMVFQKTETGADLLMAWDNLEARLPFRF